MDISFSLAYPLVFFSCYPLPAVSNFKLAAEHLGKEDSLESQSSGLLNIAQNISFPHQSPPFPLSPPPLSIHMFPAKAADTFSAEKKQTKNNLRVPLGVTPLTD